MKKLFCLLSVVFFSLCLSCENKGKNTAFYKENNNYLNHGKKNGAAHKKKVGQYDKQTGELIKIHDGLIDAAQAVGGKQTNIGACCNNRPHYLSAYGYKWRFIGGDEE